MSPSQRMFSAWNPLRCRALDARSDRGGPGSIDEKPPLSAPRSHPPPTLTGRRTSTVLRSRSRNEAPPLAVSHAARPTQSGNLFLHPFGRGDRGPVRRVHERRGASR
jgi:hypothetical protein